MKLPKKESSKAFVGPLRDCPDRPNCVCTQASRPARAMSPLVFSGDCARAIERVAGLLAKLPRAKISEQRANYLHATFTSLAFRFVDDVEFYADSESKLLHFRSASRRGYFDLGVNRRRMRRIRQLLMEQGFRKFEAS